LLTNGSVQNSRFSKAAS